MPAFISLLQIFLLLTVFRYESPVTYKQRADYDNLTQVLTKIYAKEQVQSRINEIAVQETNHTDENGDASLKLE